MDLPTIFAALTGHPVTSEDIRVVLMHGLSLAPLLPAMALVLVAAAGGGHRGNPAGRSQVAVKAAGFTPRPSRASSTAE